MGNNKQRSRSTLLFSRPVTTVQPQPLNRRMPLTRQACTAVPHAFSPPCASALQCKTLQWASIVSACAVLGTVRAVRKEKRKRCALLLQHCACNQVPVAGPATLAATALPCCCCLHPCWCCRQKALCAGQCAAWHATEQYLQAAQGAHKWST